MNQVLTNPETLGDARARDTEPEAKARTSSSKANSRARTFAPSKTQILILLGTLVFVVSHFFLWWELRLNAPQFPDGLFIQATSYEIQDSPKTPFNDIREVNGLNHYIGMMELEGAAQFEMAMAIPAIVVFTALAIAAVFWIGEKRWAPLLLIPIIIFPWAYLADLFFWLRYAGQNLDPMAAITLPPFTPTVWGVGEIMQFSTQAYFQAGWYMAVAAGIIMLVAIVMHFRSNPEEK